MKFEQSFRESWDNTKWGNTGAIGSPECKQEATDIKNVFK